MLSPFYLFTGDYAEFREYFRSFPHQRKFFRAGEQLWESGNPQGLTHYIITGTAVVYAVHEEGHRKIICFHGPDTVYPGPHRPDYRLEQSMVTEALTDMEVMEFLPEHYAEILESNHDLGTRMVEWYGAFCNLLLFETVHQNYNSALVKLCNLLLILDRDLSSMEVTQNELADILGMSRVQVARELKKLRDEGIVATSRGKLRVIDMEGLEKNCSAEVL